MSIQNVKMIDNLADLSTAFKLLKAPWAKYPREYTVPYNQAFSKYSKEGLPQEQDVSFKHINANDSLDGLHKYFMIKASLRLAVTQNILTLQEFEKYTGLYETSLIQSEVMNLNDGDAFSITFDFIE
ncbi:MAG: hypothetical protein VX154_00530 [Pseudomonadota bacterium]|nr:hypothetical protein [Pseudomonadota bacterium]